MDYHESLAMGWSNFRAPRYVQVLEKDINLDGVHVSPLMLAEIIFVHPGWICSWLGWHSLRIRYRDQQTSKEISILGGETGLRELQARIQAATCSLISRALSESQHVVEAIEVSHSVVYNPQRYLRNSQAIHFSASEKARFQSVESNVQAIAQHPLSQPPQQATSAALASRLVILSPCVKSPEYARRLHNESYLEYYRRQEFEFFKTVESQPLTSEQINAALVFEDATLVVAAAGSGKSSCIVGKIGFALKTGLFQDHEILALAYNRDAAESLRKRLNEKLEKVLQRNVSVASKTFHSFGLATLVELYGKDYEPRVLKEEGKEEGRYIKTAIAKLINEDSAFQAALIDWLSFSPYENPQPVGSSDDLDECAKRYEECCRERIKAKQNSKRKSFEATIPTFDASLYVRSLEEKAIANWLLIRGVEFFYERPDWDGATRLKLGLSANGKRKPYNPDFTYLLTDVGTDGEERSIRVVHEHFALDDQGNAPEWMGGNKYAKYAVQKRSMYQAWMKETAHSSNRIQFFETRSSQFRDGTVLQCLEKSLNDAGITVGAPQEDIREIALESFRKSSDLEKLVIDFVLRYKDSGLSKLDLLAKAQQSENPHRSLLFVNVALRVFDAYQAALGEMIDFADMIRDAVEVLKSGRVKVPYKLILVDEFQDISKLKADLVKAVLDQCPDESILFCVGDDWQTINRFAGSDVGIFTGAQAYFDRYVKRLELTHTFRCVQGIADVSRALVMTNPRQFDKEVKAVRGSHKSYAVRILFHGPSMEDRQQALDDELQRIVQLADDLKLVRPSVLLLRRTKKDYTVPEGIDDEYLGAIAHKFDHTLEFKWMTVHGSKGLEADFVIMPGLDSGFRGFPHERPAEPLLDLVLPTVTDNLEEERRLLYVGLTRARYQATVLSNAESPSVFVIQLMANQAGLPAIEWIECDAKRLPCPKCKLGSLVAHSAKPNSRQCSRRSMCGYSEKTKYIAREKSLNPC